MEKRSLVYLRPLEHSDIDRIFHWHNDPELYEHLVGNFCYASQSAVESWLEQRSAYSSRELNLAICAASTQVHIGNLYLRDIDWVARRAELHIFIGDHSERTKGFGTAAVKLAIDTAIESFGLQRLYLFVLADNQPAIRVYEKCGFQIEGCLKNHAFKQRKYCDVLVMGLLMQSDSTTSAI